MDILEWYYNELFGYAADANLFCYDLDMQMTKDRLEQIIERRYIEEEDVCFVKSLIPEITDLNKRKELEDYLAEGN